MIKKSDFGFENIIQMIVLLSVIVFVKVSPDVGKILLPTCAIGYIIYKIIARDFGGYEMLVFFLGGLLTGTNYLLYSGIILVVLYALLNMKKLRYVHYDYEIIGFVLMFLTGTVASFLNSTDEKSAHLYVQTYFFLFVLLLGVKLFQRHAVIKEKHTIRFIAWFSFLLGVGFFLTHSIEELFSTAHIFVYYISNYGVYSNTLAGMIAPFAVGCIIIAVESKDLIARVFSIISAIMLLMIILVIQSRGTYLGIMIALLWICSKKKKSKVLMGALVLGIVIVFVFTIYPDLFAKFFGRFSISHFANGDFSNGRSEAFTIAWRMFESHPIIGCGFWQFKINGIQYQDPHNYILSYLASTGVIGSFGFALYLIAGFRRLNAAYEHAYEKAYSKIMIEITMVAFLITIGHGLVEPTLSTSAPLSLFIIMTQLPIQAERAGGRK